MKLFIRPLRLFVMFWLLSTPVFSTQRVPADLRTEIVNVLAFSYRSSLNILWPPHGPRQFIRKAGQYEIQKSNLALVIGMYPRGLRSGQRRVVLPFAGPIRKVLHIGPDTLVNDWHKALHEAHDPLTKTTEAPEKYGRLLISKKSGAGDLNVGPVLSPDGKNVIFFSEKGLFAIDFFLADAETGKIKRNIVRAEKDPHWESLEFISSAGAWNAEGDRIAFALVTKGRPGLGLLDVKKAKIISALPS